MSKNNWFRMNSVASAPSGAIDRERGIIEGVTVCQLGEARGHGVIVNDEFLDRVVQFGNANRSGIKSRFGHPTACHRSLGSFMGRQKRFRREGDKVLADAFFSNAARGSPNGGDIYNYVFDIAETDPEAIMYSIQFSEGEPYKVNELGDRVTAEDPEFDDIEGLPFAVIEDLKHVDFVDQGAVTNGLFSSETIAGEIATFFDENPDFFEAISEDEKVFSALKEAIGGKFEEFISKYQVYAKQTITPTKKGADIVQDEETQEEVEPATGSEESTEASGAESTDATEAEGAESTKGNEEETNEETKEEGAGENALSAGQSFESQDLARAIEEFGAEIAGPAFAAGEGFEGAQRAYYAELKKENEKLKKKSEAFSGEQPSEFSEEPKPKKGLWSKK